MESRQITEEEVARLHTFCIQHFVRFYDVRLELVDHLATGIEDIWEKDDSIPFETALNQVYEQYGTTGFRTLMREKEKSVDEIMKKGFKTMWLNFFKPFEIITSLFFILSIVGLDFYFMKNEAKASLYSLFGVLTSLILFVNIFIFVRRYRQNKSLKSPLFCLSIPNFIYSGLPLIILSVFPIELLQSGASGLALFVEPISNYVLIPLFSISIISGWAELQYHNFLFSKARKQYPENFLIGSVVSNA